MKSTNQAAPLHLFKFFMTGHVIVDKKVADYDPVQTSQLSTGQNTTSKQQLP